MYPSDPEQALFVDELIDTSADVGAGAPQNADVDIKRKLRVEYAAGKMNIYFTYLSEKLNASEGPYFFGTQLTLADIVVYGLVKSVRNGNLDYIPTDYDSKWPEFQALVDTLENNPVFAPHKI